LRNVLRSACASASGGVIDGRHLSLASVSGQHPGATSSRVPEPEAEKASLKPLPESTEIALGPSLRDLERKALLEALRTAQGRRGQAARALGIHRSTLRRKLQQLGIQSLV